MNLENSEKIEIPVLPLRDVVVYPNMVIPLFVGREKSIRCLEAAMNDNKKVVLVAQKEASKEYPNITDLFSIGTMSCILQMLKMSDGTLKVLVEGIERVKIVDLKDIEDYFVAHVEYFNKSDISEEEQKVLNRTVINQFESYIKLNKRISPEVLISLRSIEKSEKLADTIASHMSLKVKDKQRILETSDISKRLECLMVMMESEINFLRIEKKIRDRVKKQMEKSQREYYLNEQIKAIQKELGEIENVPDEFEVFKKKIELAKMPREVKRKVESELQKLKMMSPISAEATVLRSYVDWIVNVPWRKKSRIKKNLTQAKMILDRDHDGLEKVKEHILEYLAVHIRTNKIKGPILCLVGPPGVGKTSLGKSIAKATGRRYIRMSLGGVRDEAEIRGHRRTYIGSMPGKIIQKMTKIGVKNPLFLFDEIDKISYEARGDPASALLEVLDPEQNIAFNDHYLEIDYDLSDVMFIATSNTTRIPTALLDRMEIIRISGYTEEEKKKIAKNHLFPKQFKRNALRDGELFIHDNAFEEIIRYYTREAGVRNLEREISKICRKTVKIITSNCSVSKINVDKDNLKEYLGFRKLDYGKVRDSNKIGQVTGLAWMESGGDLLTIETVCVHGKGKLTYTGSLGEIMKESIQTSLMFIRSKSEQLNIEPNFYEKKDIHVHVPDGATPKDGPSAGIAICTALVSCLTSNPVRFDVAMTGEITLEGMILPIGGLKEKLLAAQRGGIKTVIIPNNNRHTLQELPKNIIDSLKIHTVKNMKEVFSVVFQYPMNSKFINN
ncbi:endopeptidase La [Candidatus Riesia pediculischaeffi]|uniref:Lon protease n=1 Tax=Candidatus Riesia pediculischaeffi PTSU TaxID=1401651 RepID=A0A0C1S030_9ENTR|nr:endopeptidase La [Candidatus Riesia pediculischaeffi]KIE63917.1 ATP-dependent protease La [Candidatus Riesia pediculischaeffi PTSU]